MEKGEIQKNREITSLLNVIIELVGDLHISERDCDMLLKNYNLNNSQIKEVIDKILDGIDIENCDNRISVLKQIAQNINLIQFDAIFTEINKNDELIEYITDLVLKKKFKQLSKN